MLTKIKYPLLFATALSLLIISGCAVGKPAQDSGQSGSPPITAPKRLTVAIMGDPFTLSGKLNTSGPGSNVPGVDALEDLVHPGLAKFLKEHKAWNDKWKVAK